MIYAAGALFAFREMHMVTITLEASFLAYAQNHFRVLRRVLASYMYKSRFDWRYLCEPNLLGTNEA